MNSQNNDISDLRVLAKALDSQYRGPFGFRFGWDGLLGLVPVVGNAVTSAMSLYIIFRAAVIGAPTSILLRMLMNEVIDNVFDFVPVLGNIFDFIWKANLMNLALLERYLENPRQTEKRSSLVLALMIAFLFLLLVAFGVGSFFALKWVIEYLFPGQWVGPTQTI